jgi:hypothetical protein
MDGEAGARTHHWAAGMQSPDIAARWWVIALSTKTRTRLPCTDVDADAARACAARVDGAAGAVCTATMAGGKAAPGGMGTVSTDDAVPFLAPLLSACCQSSSKVGNVSEAAAAGGNRVLSVLYLSPLASYSSRVPSF